MTERTCLECVECGATDDANASVIWLHGLGADGHDFEPIVPALRLPPDARVRFVFPHAPPRPVTINGGMVMRAWYDIRSLGVEARDHDAEGIADSTGQVGALIEREGERGVEPGRIVLAGFSQGGAIALHAGLRHRARLAGVVALSAYLLFPGSLREESAPENADTPVFLAHGEFDDVVPLAAGLLARDALSASGRPVAWSTWPVPHAVHPEEITEVGRFLSERLVAG